MFKKSTIVSATLIFLAGLPAKAMSPLSLFAFERIASTPKRKLHYHKKSTDSSSAVGLRKAANLAKNVLNKKNKPQFVKLTHAGLNIPRQTFRQKLGKDGVAQAVRDLWHAGFSSVELPASLAMSEEVDQIAITGFDIASFCSSYAEFNTLVQQSHPQISISIPVGIEAQIGIITAGKRYPEHYRRITQMFHILRGEAVKHNIYIMHAFRDHYTPSEMNDVISWFQAKGSRVILSDSAGRATPEKVDQMLQQLPLQTRINMGMSFWSTGASALQLSNLVMALSHGVRQFNVGFDDADSARVVDFDVQHLLAGLGINTGVNSLLLEIAQEERISFQEYIEAENKRPKPLVYNLYYQDEYDGQ